MRVSAPRFGPLTKARFVERPNRFRVECQSLESGKPLSAFLPNPGRLRELFLPDVTLYLADTPAETRKTRYTVVAVERDGAPVFLHTHTNNQVAAHLVSHGRVPGLEGAELLAQEVRHGRSRFDMLVRLDGAEVFCEVKSVTLFGNGVAMFPDAITERGRRHVMELAELGRRGPKPVVLFLVHSPKATVFMPDYHTDLAFSQTLLAARDDVRIVAVSVSWTKTLRLGRAVCPLRIPWDYLADEMVDRGTYVIVVRAGEGIAANRFHGAVRKGRYALLIGESDEALEKHGRRKRRVVDDPFAAFREGASTWEPALIRGAHVDTAAICGAFGALGRVAHKATADRVGTRWGVVAFDDDPQSTVAYHRTLERFRMAQPPPGA